MDFITFFKRGFFQDGLAASCPFIALAVSRTVALAGVLRVVAAPVRLIFFARLILRSLPERILGITLALFKATHG